MADICPFFEGPEVEPLTRKLTEWEKSWCGNSGDPKNRGAEVDGTAKSWCGNSGDPKNRQKILIF
jgi:hypothetical protein